LRSVDEAAYAYQTRARGLLDRRALEAAFEAAARSYEARLGKFLPDDRGATCLDVPCGYGNMLYFLRRRGYETLAGWDLDSAQVALARLLDLPAREGDCFDALADPAAAYDVVTSVDFVEHLDRDRALEFLALCFARLRPGGLLILRTPCADGPFGAHDRYNDLTHRWAMTSNVLQAFLGMVGFERVAILDERPQPTSLKGALRTLAFHPVRAAASLFCLALGLDPPRVWSRSMWGVGYKPTGPVAR
jgi:2-polyprenyl-3-methyl-5-hydroxy-6-metoxy-1,4-benzoquinol methylase